MMYDRGNALFLILIAVALFAALSYAITQSGRGGGNINREEAAIAASEILQFAATVEQAVQRMRIIGGVSIYDLDFQSDQRLANNDSIKPYTNPRCTSTACRVFHPDGGGVTYQHFEKYGVRPDSWNLLWEKSGHSIIPIMGVTGLGSDLAEITIRVTNIREDICHEINRRLGLPLEPAYDFTGEGVRQMSQDYPDPEISMADPVTRTVGDDAPDLIGQTSFCIKNIGWEFYHVLVVN